MLTSLYSARSRRDADGFTLIELLVVVIIIGLLAAIALPIFIDQTRTSVDASVKADVRNTVTNVSNAQAQKLTSAKAAVSDANTSIALVAATTEIATKGALTLGNVPELGASYAVHGWNPNGKTYLGTSATGKGAYTFTAASGLFSQATGAAPSAGAAVDSGADSGSTGGSNTNGAAYGAGGNYTTPTSATSVTGAQFMIVPLVNGDVYYTHSGYSAIMKVPAGGSAAVFAGSTSVSQTTDGTGTDARFTKALSGVADASGNAYVADYNGSTTVKIRKVTPAGVVTTVANITNSNVYYGVLSMGPDGNLYYATQKSGATAAIIRINLSTGVQTTVFGFASGNAAAINAIWIGPSGTIYLTFNGPLVKVTGANTYSVVVPSAGARMVTGDAAENLYYSTGANIMKVLAGASTATAIAGSGTSVEPTMGTGSNTSYGIQMAPSGRLYYWLESTPTVLRYLS